MSSIKNTTVPLEFDNNDVPCFLVQLTRGSTANIENQTQLDSLRGTNIHAAYFSLWLHAVYNECRPHSNAFHHQIGYEVLTMNCVCTYWPYESLTNLQHIPNPVTFNRRPRKSTMYIETTRSHDAIASTFRLRIPCIGALESSVAFAHQVLCVHVANCTAEKSAYPSELHEVPRQIHSWHDPPGF